ncbi:hypothetical protein ACUN7V_15955 [Quadrisphaera oryzae]|uniref:hypothetical protein n=1 Tax=Quadrisphaera TaxID=317661 RepID=UPI0016462FF8|nr:hypothetical protein [Quadrisphaera sp. RL12-1S]MBC3763522.1 hypothetical protein [Quadrisphaera sp. RL12-1S]
MLKEALRRLLARLVGPVEEEWPPELLELDRRASVAMTLCTCGHMWHLHEHPYVRTVCDACACQRFRPAQRPDAGAGAASRY